MACRCADSRPWEVAWPWFPPRASPGKNSRGWCDTRWATPSGWIIASAGTARLARDPTLSPCTTGPAPFVPLASVGGTPSGRAGTRERRQVRPCVSRSVPRGGSRVRRRETPLEFGRLSLLPCPATRHPPGRPLRLVPSGEHGFPCPPRRRRACRLPVGHGCRGWRKRGAAPSPRPVRCAALGSRCGSDGAGGSGLSRRWTDLRTRLYLAPSWPPEDGPATSPPRSPPMGAPSCSPGGGRTLPATLGST